MLATEAPATAVGVCARTPAISTCNITQTRMRQYEAEITVGVTSSVSRLRLFTGDTSS